MRGEQQNKRKKGLHAICATKHSYSNQIDLNVLIVEEKINKLSFYNVSLKKKQCTVYLFLFIGIFLIQLNVKIDR